MIVVEYSNVKKKRKNEITIPLGVALQVQPF